MYLGDNSVKSINLSNAKKLNYLGLDEPYIRSIDLSTNDSLGNVDLATGAMSSLILKDNSNIKDLSIDSSSLKSLDLSTQNNIKNLKLGMHSMEAKMHIENNHLVFNMKDFLGDEEFKNIKHIEVPVGASYDSNTGKYVLAENQESIKYSIDTRAPNFAEENRLLNVTVFPLTKGKIGGIKRYHESYMNGYEDGTIKPDNFVTRAEAAAIFTRLLEGNKEIEDSGESKYSDVPDGWYKKYIDYVTEKGIMSGYEDGTFRPESNITRAELTKVVNYVAKAVDSITPFTDISNHWAKWYIECLYTISIVNGYSDGTFRPDNPVTRAEAVKIFNKVLNRYAGKGSFEYLDNPEAMKKFGDLSDSHWAYPDIMAAANDYEYVRIKSAENEIWTHITQKIDLVWINKFKDIYKNDRINSIANMLFR